jgi:hypothetical protein
MSQDLSSPSASKMERCGARVGEQNKINGEGGTASAGMTKSEATKAAEQRVNRFPKANQVGVMKKGRVRGCKLESSVSDSSQNRKVRT